MRREDIVGKKLAGSDGLLEEVRSSCREVAARAEQVRIRRDLIPAYCLSLSPDAGAPCGEDPARHRLGGDEFTAAYIVTLDSINFGSGYFPHIQKRPGMSGYFTVATYLRDYFREHGPLSPGRLSSLTGRDCAVIFGQRYSAAARELMDLFARALNRLGDFISGCYNGSFLSLIEAAGGSAEALAALLLEMPFFNDRAVYTGGIEVSFYKRAQITAADIALAFSRKGPGNFSDLEKLTIFADNLVPHVLRRDGILEYGKDLSARIERGELIPAGSPEEIEIRSCALHGAELIIAALSRRGLRKTALELDDILWRRGRAREYREAPRHRTRTVFY